MAKKYISKKEIVIVGGGFAGVKAALELSKRRTGKITLISDEDHFLHHATLYSTATGRNRAESVIPLVDIFANSPNVKVVQDTITAVDPERKLVVGKSSSYKYSDLIMSIGLVTTYFGIKGMQKHSFGIKTLDEIKEFNKHIQHDIVIDKQLDVNYVVVGGGPTGVELAGALQEYIVKLKATNKLEKSKTTVTLVEAADRILPRLSKTASQKSTKQLKAMGVKVLTSSPVELVEDDFVVIDGKKIPTESVIWTAGVANHPFFAKHSDIFTLAKNGRVEVDEYLEAYPNIYVLGDNNSTKYSGMAWPALSNGKFIAKHLTRLYRKVAPRKYRAIAPPSGIPIGDSWAYVEWYGIYVSGKTGYYARRFMELYGYRQLVPLKIALAAWRSHDLTETDV
jgi:NADH dehydrogenase